MSEIDASRIEGTTCATWSRPGHPRGLAEEHLHRHVDGELLARLALDVIAELQAAANAPLAPMATPMTAFALPESHWNRGSSAGSTART